MRVSLTASWLATATALFFVNASATYAESLMGLLGLPKSLETAFAPSAHPAAVLGSSERPHPAVARIVVPEGNEATSYGSGTLVDVRDQFGLVVTNWHVVRDGNGEVEVIFPDGFRSKARPLKVDSDWDLAALVIWRPPVQPVTIAAAAPQPGDQLTICGYGSGQYRAATGRCTQYYAPAVDLPQHMVELDVEARQGDSGGPIFNERGELAGVLFGAGRGTTLGSFGGRVGSFLAPLAPDIGGATDAAFVQGNAAPTTMPTASGTIADAVATKPREHAGPSPPQLANLLTEARNSASDVGWKAVATLPVEAPLAAAPSSGSSAIASREEHSRRRGSTGPCLAGAPRGSLNRVLGASSFL